MIPASSSDQSTDENDDDLSAEQYINELLRPILTSSSGKDQITALSALSARIVEASAVGAVSEYPQKEEREDADKDKDKNLRLVDISSIPQIRERLAVHLLQQVVVVERPAQDALVCTVLSCGPLEALCAAVQSLKGLSSSLTSPSARNTTTNKNYNSSSTTSNQSSVVHEWSPCSLDVSFRILKRLLLMLPSQVDGVIELGGIKGLVETLKEGAGSIVSPSSRDVDEISNDIANSSSKPPEASSASFYDVAVMDRLVGLAISVPSLVANACLAVRSPLPAWAVPSRYFARLVQCACSQAVLEEEENDDATRRQQKMTAAAHDKEEKTAQLAATTTIGRKYFQTLVQTLVRHRGGEDAAAGIFKHHHEQQNSNNGDSNNDINDNWNAKKQEQNYSSALETLLLDIHMEWLTDRESAVLIRAVLRQVLSLVVSTNNKTTTLPVDDDDDNISARITTRNAVLWEQYKQQYSSWVNLSCRSILLNKNHRNSKSIREAVVRLVILSPSSVLSCEYSDRLLCHCVANLLCGNGEASSAFNNTRNVVSTDDSDWEDSSSDDDDDDTNVALGDTILLHHLKDVAAAWSQTIFVRQTDNKMQRHVSRFLISGLQLLNKNNTSVDPTSDLVANVLEGVTTRLHSSLESIRKDGMRVAEQLALQLGEALKFEELDIEREREHHSIGGSENITSTAKKDEVKRNDACPKASTKVVPGYLPRQIDPDADYISDDDSNEEDGWNNDSEAHEDSSDSDDDNSVWEDGDSQLLIPYDLDDDEEDLREAPRPLYLIECLEYLRTPESEDHACSRHEASLKELPSLIRARPADLPDIGPSLAMELLRMENKFNIENHSTMKLDSMCALVIEEPSSVGQTLIANFFEDCCLTDRLNVLATLHNAAKELSGNLQLEERRKLAVTNKQQQQSVRDPRVSGKRNLVSPEDKVVQEQKTRRWGRGQYHTESSATLKNHFAKIAPIWFYSLVSNFVQTKDNSSLWGENIGSTLLSKFILILASIVEFSGNAPGTSVLAKDLFDIVWVFRMAEVSEVRRSVLVAVATVFRMLREEMLLSLLLDESSLDSVPRNLHEIAINDPDANCRSLAATTIDFVGEQQQKMLR